MKKTNKKKPVTGRKPGRPRKQPESDETVLAVVDKFIDENTELDPESAYVPLPSELDVRDELSHMEGFKDYLDESRGNTLSYGDY